MPSFKKNMAKIGWRELYDSNSESRYDVLLDSLGITREEAEAVINKPLDAARLIFSKTQKMDLPFRESLAEITTSTLASLVERDWNTESPRLASKELKKMFGSDRELFQDRYGITLPYIHFLRASTFKAETGRELLPNVLNSNGWDLKFSNRDLVKGTKVPHQFTEIGTALMGVYFAVGCPADGYKFILNIDKQNSEFHQIFTIPSIGNLFNINTKIIPNKTVKKGFSDKLYSFNAYDLTVISKAHSEFVARYFNFWASGKGTNHKESVYSIPRKLSNEKIHPMQDYDTAYHFFSGIVNSRGCVVRENGSSILIMIDKNISYLDAIKQCAEAIGLEPTLKPKNDSNILRFSRKDLEKIVNMEPLDQYETPLREYVPEQRGLIINPYQLRSLENF